MCSLKFNLLSIVIVYLIVKPHYCQAAHVKLHGLDVLYDQMKNEVDVCKGIRLDCRIPGFGKGFKVES